MSFGCILTLGGPPDHVMAPVLGSFGFGMGLLWL